MHGLRCFWVHQRFGRQRDRAQAAELLPMQHEGDGRSIEVLGAGEQRVDGVAVDRLVWPEYECGQDRRKGCSER